MSSTKGVRAIVSAMALAAGLSWWARPLRADVVINRFDTAAEAGQWRFDFGNVGNTIAWDPNTDADANPNSGSLMVTFNFDATLGGDNKGAITRDIAPTIDGTQITGLSMDVMIDPNSATDAFGGNGYGTLAIRNGDNYDWQPQFNDNMSAAAGWRHISVSPLTGTVNAIRALTFQLYGGPTQNITGPVTFWVDNVVLNQMLLGDANLDGKVDFADLLILAQNYGLTAGALWGQGDFNNDGAVGFDDLLILAQNYGTGVTPAELAQLNPAFRSDVERAFAQVPEPASVTSLSLAAACLLRRRRRA